MTEHRVLLADRDVESVRAWDVPTRAFHWSLVTLVVMAYVSRKWGDEGLKWHTWNGYAILVLLVFRILWGFVGGSTARFSSFVYAPWTAARYGVDFLRRAPRHFLGHNPLGGSMVFVMLALISAQAVSGLFSYDDHDSLTGGPLSSKVAEATVAALTKWHIWLFDIILVVVALHILANVAYLFWKRENLVRPMITGRKPATDFEDQQEARFGSPVAAVVCLVLAIAIVYGGITLAGGRIL